MNSPQTVTSFSGEKRAFSKGNSVPVSEMMQFWRRSDGMALGIIAWNYAIIMVLIVAAVWNQSWAFDAAAVVLIAGRQVALLNLVHAAAHGSLFASKIDDTTIDWLVGFVIFDSVGLYRPSHLEHHRDFRLADPLRYYYLHEDLQLHRRGGFGRTWVVFLRPLLGHAGWNFAWESIQLFFCKPRVGGKVILYWLGVAGFCWWQGWLWYLVRYWLVPLVWLYPVLNLWAEVGDHFQARGPGEARNFKGWIWWLIVKPYDNYHCIHHFYPHIPFYRHREAEKYLLSRGFRMEVLAGIRGFLQVVYRKDRDGL